MVAERRSSITYAAFETQEINRFLRAVRANRLPCFKIHYKDGALANPRLVRVTLWTKVLDFNDLPARAKQTAGFALAVSRVD